MAYDDRNTYYPKPPTLPDDLASFEEVLDTFDNFRKQFQSLARYERSRRDSLKDMIRDFHIDKLTVGTIFADNTLTEDLFIGGEEFALRGEFRQLIIKDRQSPPETRVKMGEFGSGASYGAQFYNADGTLFIDITDNVQIQTAASGQRVILDKNGLEAFNSSEVKTIDINTDGSVNLGPTGGTYISVSGAGITINGEVVGTGNLVAKAVTQLANNFDATQTHPGIGADIITQSITTSGYPVAIWAGFTGINTNGGSSAFNWELSRGSTTLRTKTFGALDAGDYKDVSIVEVNTPSAGTYTFKLNLPSATGLPGSVDLLAKYIVLLEAKKAT